MEASSLKSEKLVILSSENCPYCERIKIFSHLNKYDSEISFDEEKDSDIYPVLVKKNKKLKESLKIIEYINNSFSEDKIEDKKISIWDDLVLLWKRSFYEDITEEEFKNKANHFINDLNINNYSISILYPHLMRFEYTKNISFAYKLLSDLGLYEKIESFVKSKEIKSFIVDKETFISSFLNSKIVDKKQFYGLVNNRIYLDTAATALCMKKPVTLRESHLDYYASTHSTISKYSEKLNTMITQSRNEVLSFLGLDETYSTLFFGQGATSAANYLSTLLNNQQQVKYGISLFEHHSNDLPFRKSSKVIRFPSRLSNQPIEEAILKGLESACINDEIDHVIITACSNVTGYMPPIIEISKLCNEYNVSLFLDISQSISHKRINLKQLERLDGLYFSGHKIYAPGTPGVIVAKKSLLTNLEPALLGGGSVSDVSKDDYELLEAVESKHQPGTQDVLGIIQLSETLRILNEIGMRKIYTYEKMLTEYAYIKLSNIENIIIYSSPQNSVSLISFNIIGMDHYEVAKKLFDDYSIEVRNACFCAHPYVRELLRIDAIKRNDFSYEYTGMIRISLGIYNTKNDIDQVINAIKSIVANSYSNTHQDKKAINHV
jgi:cysteine desulfurase/selenocysteine lyase